jgi:hypothetical protein
MLMTTAATISPTDAPECDDEALLDTRVGALLVLLVGDGCVGKGVGEDAEGSGVGPAGCGVGAVAVVGEIVAFAGVGGDVQQ